MPSGTHHVCKLAIYHCWPYIWGQTLRGFLWENVNAQRCRYNIHKGNNIIGNLWSAGLNYLADKQDRPRRTSRTPLLTSMASLLTIVSIVDMVQCWEQMLYQSINTLSQYSNTQYCHPVPVLSNSINTLCQYSHTVLPPCTSTHKQY